MSDLTKFDFGCENCIEFWNTVRFRRNTSMPIDESKLHFCNHCYRPNSRHGLRYKNDN